MLTYLTVLKKIQERSDFSWKKIQEPLFVQEKVLRTGQERRVFKFLSDLEVDFSGVFDCISYAANV